MITALEQFALQLARVSKRGSRFLRGLSEADRDDVIAAAVLWCWEHQAEFDQHVQPLDGWFAARLKAARRALGKGRPSSDLDTLMAIENTERNAEARSALERLCKVLTPAEQAIAAALGEGLSIAEVTTKLKVNRTAVRRLKRRLHDLRSLLPNERAMLTPRSAVLAEDDDVHPWNSIDHALNAMLSLPRPGKDCPPCWRCCWFLGFIPDPKSFHPSDLHEIEVRTAVRETEIRKIRIANSIRTRPLSVEAVSEMEDAAKSLEEIAP